MGLKPRTRSTPSSDGRFRTVLADPAWAFRDMGSRLSPSHAGYYSTQSLGDIKAMASLVGALVADDSFLFLWAPNCMVLEGQAQDVARTWGFEPKQLIPWIKTSANGKPRLGGGHYTRVVSEMLLLCRRGRATVVRKDVPGVIHAPRGRHSAKPDESYDLIEKLVAGPFLELYARRRYNERWTVWGNQLEEAVSA